MITPALLSYIQQSLSAGKSKEKIKSELLLAGGWQESEVDAAFATLQTGPYKKSFGSKVASFFLTLLIIIVIIGGLVFAAEKYLGPVAGEIGQSIIAALPFNKDANQPAAVDTQPATSTPVVQSPIVPAVSIQSPVVQSPEVTAPAVPPAPVTCDNSDTACLMQAAATCAPAKEINVTKMGSSLSTRIYTIVGPQENQCRLTFSVKSDSDKKFSGKSAACMLSTDELTALLSHWITGDFYSPTGVNLYEQCSGTYFNN